MSTYSASMTHSCGRSRKLVDPALFAERLLSRDALERIHLPEDDLLGVRNRETGETLYVNEIGFRTWLQHRG